jgi:xylulokinase
MSDGILIVDIGTSKVHTNLVDIANGDLLETKSCSYTWIHPQEGWSEADPESIWKAAESTIQAIEETSRKKYEIKAIAFSYIGDSLLIVDKKFRPLRNMILAFDNRARLETQEFIDQFSEKEFTRITGSTIMPELVPFKIMWLMKNQPDLFKETAKLWNIQQFMNHKLGLVDATDFTLACRKILFDIHNKKWSDELCEYLKISPEMLGNDILPSDSIIGSINRFGTVSFEQEIPVMLGAHDSESGMIGLGCIPGSDDVIGNITGTYDHIGYLPKTYADKLEGFITSYCGPLKDSYVLLGATIAGPNLDWFVKTFYPQENLAAIDRLFNLYRFDGMNKVYLTRGVQTGNGCIRGINFNTKLENIFQAVVEGVTYPLKDIFTQMKKFNGRNFGRMRVGGGGAKSDQWSQLKSDMFQIYMEKVVNTEISSLGAAIMAAVSEGYYSDISTAMSQMIRVVKTFEPNEVVSKRYEERFREFLAS